MDEGKQKLFAEEENQIIRERIPYIREQYPRVREAYQNHYDWPELDSLRHEIALCITLGLFQAAITLTNHFLESLVKYTLIYHDSEELLASHSGNARDILVSGTADARAKYGRADLGKNINALCRVGFITKAQKEKLDQMRESMRNPYSHVDKEKIFQDETIGVQPAILAEDKFEVAERVESKLADLPIVQGFAQAAIAKRDAPSYFLYVDSLARELWAKLLESDC